MGDIEMNKFLLRKGFLKVDHHHELYYEVCGNPLGIPILFVHGGPGAGFTEADKRFFDYEVFKVIFYDQRGASKSKPFGSTETNTTQELVNDILKVLNFLNIESCYVFGGSWGTTLSLCFAIENPDKVKGLILRGVFLADRNAINHYLGGGVKTFYPEAWMRFIDKVPENEIGNVPSFYLEQMKNGSSETRSFFAYEWAYYEISIFQKCISSKQIEGILERIPYESLATLEAHYLSNNCFLQEGFIMNNVEKIENIRTYIIHGRFDMICPPIQAYNLNQKLKNSTMKVVDAGHSDFESEIESAIKNALEEIKRIEYN
ncbi:prolyl aminopeptidase [Galbibacter mesophilus]|uniref:prolyl aminopeptidase n=1 Tax=Galbibacter mesophilus TaxID=379069 RepID=UPI00191DA1E4|nr:prolyl aminopeptidase [Galbibacter mesophilus]MCM5661837.1 prolyl aminopeptidase [Galbibacter mesophilus]